jgi:energy-coupling factor transport system permease protein
MIRDVTLGQYYPGESILHRTDPRTKILLTMLYMATIFSVRSYMCYIMLTLFTMLAIFLSGIPIRHTLRGLKPVLFIMVFVILINMFTVSGHTLIRFYFIRITYEGLDMAIKMALRLTLLIVSASLLTLTTTPIFLTDGIEKLMEPFKRIGVPAHEIAMMMTIALRFIPTLMEETDKIMKAQAARGADFDTGNIFQRAKSFVPVLVPLFVSAFRRADDLATAMEARCYRGSDGRTRMKQLKFTVTDITVSSATIFFCLGIIILEYAV